MDAKTVKLVDRQENLLGTALVVQDKDFVGGTVELNAASFESCRLFGEFERIVNGQMFSLLDQVQDRIAKLDVRAVFSDGRKIAVHDLQVFPSAGEVSFKLAESGVTAAKLG